MTKLIDYALVVLQLFMFKVYRNFEISKIELFNFSRSERVKQCVLIKCYCKDQDLVKSTK